MNHAAALNALVVAMSDNFTIQHQHRTDGNTALGQSFFGFVNRGLEKNIHALPLKQAFDF